MLQDRSPIQRYTGKLEEGAKKSLLKGCVLGNKMPPYNTAGLCLNTGEQLYGQVPGGPGGR